MGSLRAAPYSTPGGLAQIRSQRSGNCGASRFGQIAVELLFHLIMLTFDPEPTLATLAGFKMARVPADCSSPIRLSYPGHIDPKLSVP